MAAARPRTKGRERLPDHLYYDVSKKKYVFTLINGVRKTLGTNKDKAIMTARQYNNIMRPAEKDAVKELINLSGGLHGEARPLSEYIDNLMARIIQDEEPSENTKADWINDAKRVKEFFSKVSCSDIELSHVNEYIQHYHAGASANVQNRKVSFLKKVFSYAVDESLMLDNPAERKKLRKADKKIRSRLSLEAFILIRDKSEQILEGERFLKVAMNLSLQTTQARLEVTRIKYNIKEPANNVCGCVNYSQPLNGIYGTMYIHRQKTQEKEASHIAIPIGSEIKSIIDDSRDGIASPYIVHRLPKRTTKISKEVDHPTQVSPDYLSRAFSKVRDELGLYSDLPIEERPTFHEIRALAAHLFERQGINPQARMAHSDEKSTKVYTSNHIDWVEVPHSEIKIA